MSSRIPPTHTPKISGNGSPSGTQKGDSSSRAPSSVVRAAKPNASNRSPNPEAWHVAERAWLLEQAKQLGVSSEQARQLVKLVLQVL